MPTHTNNAFAGSWSSLPIPLTEWLLDVIHSMGFTQMTPVQASTIPLFMKHKDVIVEAVTGSGKTLAFVIPILDRLLRREARLKRNEIGALVISPTRELASQIHSQFSLFLRSQPRETEQPYPEPLLLVSSEHSSPDQDVQRFLSTGADIVIGTPGRLEEFLVGKGRPSVSVKELEVLVMDEADRLLDFGFQSTLTKIITQLPKQRRTGLFSATMTDADALSELVRVGLRNPARIVVKVQAKKVTGKGTSQCQMIEERRTPANLQIYYIKCRFSEKLVQLIRIIEFETRHKSSSHLIVYVSTCACVDYFYKILPAVTKLKATFYSLHGNLSPSTRTRTLDAFASSIASPSKPSILLATDVAARGLDLPQVDSVVQFDSPTDTKAFSHRCGRTARAGRSGTAWILLSGREIEFCDFLGIRKVPIREWPYLESDNDGEAMSDARHEDPDVDNYLRKIRGKLSTDRALHDLSAKAFVSFIRAYSKHEASYIFRVKDLDMIGVAKCYGLLRLPRMPELKSVSREGWEDDAISWERYAYADTAREAKRSAVAENTEHTASSMQNLADKMKNAAWSSQKERKEGKQKRLEKKLLKKKWLATKNAESSGERLSKKRGLNDIRHDDWEDLAREEKLAKRVRKGKVSQQEFDAEFGDLVP